MKGIMAAIIIGALLISGAIVGVWAANRPSGFNKQTQLVCALEGKDYHINDQNHWTCD